MQSEKDKPYFVHHSAIVEEPVTIGRGTKIWHFTHVMKEASIGEECVLGQNVFVASKVFIGNRVRIQNNVSIYEKVLIEDDVFVGPAAVFTNVINPRSFISRKNEYRQTKISKGATIGANATIICGVTVGQYAMVGAGAVVTKSVPGFSLAVGNPARIAGWVCRCGFTLEEKGGEGAWVCPSCSSKYRLTGVASLVPL